MEVYVLGSIVVRCTFERANQCILSGSFSQIDGTVKPSGIGILVPLPMSFTSAVIA